MKSDQKCDLLVIGGGPGGYVAAIRAAQLGMKVAVVERESLGGICLNWGCIPTKALLRSAEVLSLLEHAEQYGVEIPVAPGANLAAMVKRSRAISQKLSKGIEFLLKKNKVTVHMGEARLVAANAVSIRGNDGAEHTVEADNVIVSTGARAREVGHLTGDGERIWTYRDALVVGEIPSSLLVVGSGAIGIEFASFFSSLGSEVTVVEALPNILPVEDLEISKMAASAFAKRNITLLTSAKVTNLTRTAKGVSAQIVDAKDNSITNTFDRVLLAIGIVANVEGLGLEQLGVTLQNGHIATDEYGRTNVAGVWAIGDVAGAPWLAHKASHEGIVAVETIAGLNPHPMRRDNIPGCTYSSPQVASIGMTEQAALDAGHEVRVGRFQFQGNGKALALGESSGMIKTVFDKNTGELLGAHMIGAEVTEMIQGYVIARSMEATEADLMHTVFPHPTLSEMMHESVLDAYGRAIHQ